MAAMRARHAYIAVVSTLIFAAGCGGRTPGAPNASPEPAAASPPVTETLADPTHPEGTRTGISEVDAVLDAVERGDRAALGRLLVFQELACRTVIRDAGDLPACPNGLPDGSLVSVFPESFCEGSYVHEGNELAAFDALESARLYGVYRGSRLGPPSDYAIVLSSGGGVWKIDEGRVTAIRHGCGFSPEDLVWSSQLTDVILAPVASASCGPADAPQRFHGDLDGNGDRDQAYVARYGDDIRVGACRAGTTSEISVGGMATAIVGVRDVDGDGRSEIFFGDSTALSFIIGLATLVDDELVRVTRADTTPLLFEIARQPGEGGAVISGSGMACIDTDDDGDRELVGLSYEQIGDVVEWEQQPYELSAGVAVPLEMTRGTLTSPKDEPVIALLHGATCDGVTFFSAAPITPAG